ncbi:MAG: glutathionylspermidine synthase family protein [Clostridium butyricum]|nr:glutathionylspermidine synthase family protein [Clostridium butyricum]
MNKQIKYTEDILFNNYMVSGLGEEYVHSQIPFFIEKHICEKMKYYSEEINRIALEILNNINGKHKELLNYFDDFPLKEKIFNLKCPIAPMYWARYDTFINKENQVYFAEFNYDKPCGQKEIHLAEKCEFEGNLNEGFIENVKEYLINISKEYCGQDNKVNVGFLMDPCHYEELHHSYYFKDILKDTNINIVQVGNNNLSVKHGYVYAYSQVKLDIILRLFPTEFFHEIRNIEEVLDSFNENKVLLINDPRIIAIQSKGFFAYLWKLIKENSQNISEKDKEIIKRCIPYTEILTYDNLNKVKNNKEKYVVKSSLGRYSQEVYIGKYYEDKEWDEEVSLILKSGKIYIVQDLINIREEYTYAPDYRNTNIPLLAYGNFGVYIMEKKSIGYLVRWSREFLTDDYYTWMSPLGIDEYPIKIESPKFADEEERIKAYEYLNEELSFNYDFTGGYTNSNEYISLDRMIINSELYDEIKRAGSKFCSILEKVYPHIRDNIELFGPILGIPESLYKIVRHSQISELCALGRIDFALDNCRNLKILEFNSETPAGLVESIAVNTIIKEKFNVPYINPNENFKDDVKKTLKSIIEQIEKHKSIENIAVVTSWYYEDIYNTEIISNILKEFDSYNIIFGNIYDLKKVNNKIFMYGKEIQAMYRYYPLDWFYYNEDMKKFIEVLSSEEYLINSGHTLITQSKAFFAILHELINKGILTEEEERFIVKYIPYTSLEKDKKLSGDYIIKPYLSREGDGITMNLYSSNCEYEDCIFQDRVNIRPFNVNVYSTINKTKKYQFPILGAYITSNKVSGLYTRMGDIITDKNAQYIPTFID